MHDRSLTHYTAARVRPRDCSTEGMRARFAVQQPGNAGGWHERDFVLDGRRLLQYSHAPRAVNGRELPRGAPQPKPDQPSGVLRAVLTYETPPPGRLGPAGGCFFDIEIDQVDIGSGGGSSGGMHTRTHQIVHCHSPTVQLRDGWCAALRAAIAAGEARKRGRRGWKAKKGDHKSGFRASVVSTDAADFHVSGYLDKKSSSAVRGLARWQRRWFIGAGHYLRYYAAPPGYGIAASPGERLESLPAQEPLAAVDLRFVSLAPVHAGTGLAGALAAMGVSASNARGALAAAELAISGSGSSAEGVSKEHLILQM